MWYGDYLHDIQSLFGFIITLSLLQKLGDKPFESGKIICLSCIHMMKVPLIEFSLRAAQSGMSSEDRAFINAVGDIALVAVGDGESPIINCTWGYVIATAGTTNFVPGRKKDL